MSLEGTAAPHSRLANKTPVTQIEPHPTREVGAVAARCELSSCSPCHPRAISSGHQRYPADNHGHSEKAGGLGAPPLTWSGGGGRNCMACKGSWRRRS
jgi:hypothetical protein